MIPTKSSFMSRPVGAVPRLLYHRAICTSAGLIWANNRAMLQDRISALRNANVYERHSYRHLVGLPFITGEQPATASCETPFMVARIMHDGHTDLYFTGVYHDEFDASGDALLLRSRVVVCDSSRVDTADRSLHLFARDATQ